MVKDRLRNECTKDTFDCGFILPSNGLETLRLHSKEKEALMYFMPIAAGDLLPLPIVDFLWGE